ncbi:MAG TPA: hypothetical protein VGB67_14190 [Fibrella sp.]
MQTCHLLNYSGVSRKQLTHCLQRTGWLNEGQSGTFSEVMLVQLKRAADALIFLHLPDPDQPIPEAFRPVLAQHPAVIVTSPYPVRLFRQLPFAPFDFLTEPLSFENFALCLEKYVAIYG